MSTVHAAAPGPRRTAPTRHRHRWTPRAPRQARLGLEREPGVEGSSGGFAWRSCEGLSASCTARTLAPLAAAARGQTRLERGAAGRDRRLLRVEARLNAR